MRETLEQLKAIRNGAPYGACSYLSVFDTVYYLKLDGLNLNEWIETHSSWTTNVKFEDVNSVHSLSDIERQIELLELIDDIRALGFLEESHDSGVTHRKVCKRAKELLG